MKGYIFSIFFIRVGGLFPLNEVQKKEKKNSIIQLSGGGGGERRGKLEIYLTINVDQEK